MISSNIITKVLNAGRFVSHSYFYIPLAGLKTKDAIELPEKPKKPSTAFFRFIQEHKPSLLMKYPELKITELVKKCAEDWKSVHPTVRERYDNDYKAEMDTYAKNYLDYTMKLTDEQKDYIRLLNKEKSESSKKRRLKKKMKNMNKPKRPSSAFLLYLIEQSKVQGRNIKDLMTNMKGAWHLLDESEKVPYLQEAEQLKKKYNQELEIWEKKMLKEGHKDLVRTKVLAENPHLIPKKKSPSKTKESKSSDHIDNKDE